MEDLSLHILDIAENSICAGADVIEIKIEENTKDDLLILEVRDNGKGIDREMINKVTDPFFTTKTVRRVGLGLPLLKQSSEECDGHFSITSAEGKGTDISASFRRSHIDRKPLGDIASTLIVLIAANPQIDIIFEYKRNGYGYRFDTSEIKPDLGDIPINTPSVLKVIKEELRRGLKSHYYI